jgi:hypothetical protein
MKILYIAGLGRSGSTLLNLFLGKSSNILALGEIDAYRKDLKKRILNESCSCTKRAKDCDFWQGFSNYLDRNPQINFYESLVCYVKYKYPDKRVIIDSSKTIIGMKSWINLRENNPYIQLFTIHLVRDIRGWSYSQFKRMENTSISIKLIKLIKKVSAWYNINKEFDIVLSEYPAPNLRIGYEEFIFNRKKVLDLIFLHLNEANFISQYNSLANSDAHELSKFSSSIKASDINYDFYWMNSWLCSILGFISPAIFKMNKKYVYGTILKEINKRISDIPKNQN